MHAPREGWPTPCRHPRRHPQRQEWGWRAAAPKGTRNSPDLPVGSPASTSDAFVEHQATCASGNDGLAVGRQQGSACTGWRNDCSQRAAPRAPPLSAGLPVNGNRAAIPSRRLITFPGCREMVISTSPRAAADAPTRQRGMRSPAAPRSSPRDQNRRDPRERGLARRVGRVGRSLMLRVGGVARH